MKSLTFLLLFGLVLMDGPRAFAFEEWESGLKVSMGKIVTQVFFGQRQDATKGVDGRYDVPALPGGKLNAYFLLGRENLWRDIRPGGSGSWDLRIDSMIPEEQVVLSWDGPDIPGGCHLQLTDLQTGEVIDLEKPGNHAFSNQASRRMMIEITHLGAER